MSVTPDFVGQRYKDTNTGNIWIANSTTPGDWTLEVQNMEWTWEPRTTKLGETIGYYIFGDLLNVDTIRFLGTTSRNGFWFEGITGDVQTISCPNLLTIDPSFATSFGGIFIKNAPTVTTLSAPQLVTIGGFFELLNCTALTSLVLTSLNYAFSISVSGCSALTSVSLPSLTSANSDTTIRTNASLVTISIPNFLPYNGQGFDGSNCALNAASVNQILARHVAEPTYVSGQIKLTGVNNAAPTGQGIVDKATLIGRGVNVTTQ